MKDLGVLLMVLMWVVCLVATINVIHDWIQAHFPTSSDYDWLHIMGSFRRMR